MSRRGVTSPRALLLTAGLAGIALLGPTVRAQPESSPPPPESSPPQAQPAESGPRPARPVDTQSDPVFNSEGVDQLTLEMLQRRAAPPAVAPVIPRVRVVIPPDIGQATNPFIGLKAGGLGAARAELIPEGTFLVRRRGSVVKSQTGDVVFLAHPDAQGAAERAIVILPSPGLEQIEADLERLGPRAVCYLTGQVFQYRWQNYILPTAVNVTAAPEAVTPEQAQPPVATPDAEVDGQPAAEPGPGPATADDVIRDLESRRGRPRSISRPTPPTPTPTEAGTASLQNPEVEAQPGLLTERRARIVRRADGQLAVVFDRGFGPGPESTMRLLECAALQRLEGQPLGNEPVFLISGRAVPYRGRTYFLLAGFHTSTVSDVNSLQ